MPAVGPIKMPASTKLILCRMTCVVEVIPQTDLFLQFGCSPKPAGLFVKLKANKRKSGEMKEFVCDFPNFDSCNAAKYSVIDSTVASGVLWENQNERKEVASELSLTTRLPQNQFPDLEARRFFKGRVEYFRFCIYFLIF